MAIFIGDKDVAGGSGKLYQHHIKMGHKYINQGSIIEQLVEIDIISLSNTAFTKTSLAKLLYDNGHRDRNTSYVVNFNMCKSYNNTLSQYYDYGLASSNGEILSYYTTIANFSFSVSDNVISVTRGIGFDNGMIEGSLTDSIREVS